MKVMIEYRYPQQYIMQRLQGLDYIGYVGLSHIWQYLVSLDDPNITDWEAVDDALILIEDKLEHDWLVVRDPELTYCNVCGGEHGS